MLVTLGSQRVNNNNKKNYHKLIAEFPGDVSGVCIFMDTRCTTNI